MSARRHKHGGRGWTIIQAQTVHPLQQMTYSLANEIEAFCDLSLEMVSGEVVEDGSAHHERWHQRQPIAPSPPVCQDAVKTTQIELTINGRSAYENDDGSESKGSVSVNELQRISDCTRGAETVDSQNFWAKNPPSPAPKKWT